MDVEPKIGKDVVIDSGTTILPSTVIRGKTQIGSYCEIGPAALIDNCTISDGISVGNINIKEQILKK